MTAPRHPSAAQGVRTLPADWRDYLALMKPRVMTLVVFTAFAGYVAAPSGIHPVMAAQWARCGVGTSCSSNT